MKKFNVLTFITLITIIAITSCSETENIENNKINSIEAKGLINFDLKSKKVYVVENSDAKSKSSVNQHSIKHLFTFDSQMKSFDSEDELKSYLSENPNKVYGEYEVFIDEELAYSVQIIKGEKFNEQIFESSIANKSIGCTFAQVKACAIDRIRSQNWYDMTLCIIEGLGCVAHYYATCAVDLCFS